MVCCLSESVYGSSGHPSSGHPDNYDHDYDYDDLDEKMTMIKMLFQRVWLRVKRSPKQWASGL